MTTKLLKKLLLTVSLVYATFTYGQTTTYSFTTDLESFTEGAVVSIAQRAETGTDGVLEMTPSGNQKFPRIDRVVSFDTSVIKNVKIVVKNGTMADQIRLRVTGTGNNWIPIGDPISQEDTAFQTYFLNDIAVNATDAAATWTGTITSLQFQFRNFAGGNAALDSGTILIDEISFSDTPFTLSTKNIVKDDSSISLFPNPATDNLTITSPNQINKLEVFNMLGQSVLSSDSGKISVSSLTKGVYIAKILQDGGIVSTKRFIKE